jgi:hypothetical protein
LTLGTSVKRCKHNEVAAVCKGGVVVRLLRTGRWFPAHADFLASSGLLGASCTRFLESSGKLRFGTDEHYIKALFSGQIYSWHTPNPAINLSAVIMRNFTRLNLGSILLRLNQACLSLLRLDYG